MKREQLFTVIGEIDDRYIAEAFRYAPEAAAVPPERKANMKPKRILTLALAAALILALGVTAYASGWFGLSTRMIETEIPDFGSSTPDLTPAPGGFVASNGEADSPEAQASLAWAKAEESYCQANWDWKAVDAWTAQQEDPACEIYHCFNQEMLDMLHGIAEEYGLRLHSEVAYPMTQEQFKQVTGLGDFLRGEDNFWQGHYIFEDGSFKCEGELALEGGRLVFTLQRSRAGVLAPYGMYVRDPVSYDEWQISQDGHSLNLALRQNDTGFDGLIFVCEGEDFITLSYGAQFVPGTPAEFGREGAEAVAACFDFDALCGGAPDLDAVNGRKVAPVKPKEGLMSTADFAETPEYQAASRFHCAYNEYYDAQQTHEYFVKGQYMQEFYAPFPTGVEELDTLLQELQSQYALRVPTSAQAIFFGDWARPEWMTSLMSYRIPEGASNEDFHLREATDEETWELLGVENFLRSEESYLASAVAWDTGAWQALIVYGSTSYELCYVPKGSFCPTVRAFLHPGAESWAYETACGEQVSLTVDGEMEYPRFTTPLGLYETDTAYVLLQFPGMCSGADLQLFADNIDFTKFS